MTDSINPAISTAKSEPIPIQNNSTLINPTSENIDSEKIDIQPQPEITPDSQNVLSVKPLRQIIKNTSTGLPSVEATSHNNTAKLQKSDFNITSKPTNFLKSQSLQPQFDSTTADNIDIDDSSTAIQPRIENQSQLPQQSLTESQPVESLPVEKNPTSPIDFNQDITQSQPVESQSSDNLVESDNQIVQPQSITTSQQPQFDSTTADNNDIDDSSTAIQPQLDNQQQLLQQNLPPVEKTETKPIEENNPSILVQQPIFNQDITQSQPVESQSSTLQSSSQKIDFPQSETTIRLNRFFAI